MESLFVKGTILLIALSAALLLLLIIYGVSDRIFKGESKLNFIMDFYLVFYLIYLLIFFGGWVFLFFSSVI